MRITFKLYAMLEDYLPREHGEHRRVGNVLPLDVPEGTTVQSVIDQFGLPVRLVHLVLVDGRYVEPGDRASRALTEGEVLAIWPPVAGG
ncbi:MAG: MoaD/ThiS family protein [Burkholderiaceae bacterium]|nr:MoaD/ThiS family protein [Burkholderiaceae bacterium]